MPAIESDRRWWQTADRSRLVEDGDPEAAYLFAAKGDQISRDDVARYGLQDPDEVKALAAGANKMREPGEDKDAPANVVPIGGGDTFTGGSAGGQGPDGGIVPPAETVHDTAESLGAITVAELKALAVERGVHLQAGANKAEIIDALLEAQHEAETAAANEAEADADDGAQQPDA